MITRDYYNNTTEVRGSFCRAKLESTGYTIRKIRQKKNMKQKELSEKTDIPLSTISQIETGKYFNVTYRQLLKISFALCVPLSTIINSGFYPEEMDSINKFLLYYPYIEPWRIYDLIFHIKDITSQHDIYYVNDRLEDIYQCIPPKIRTYLDLKLNLLFSNDNIESIYNKQTVPKPFSDNLTYQEYEHIENCYKQIMFEKSSPLSSNAIEYTLRKIGNTERDVIGMGFSIRLNEEEKKLAEAYAKIHSISVGEAFKRALFERIEDEYDSRIADEAYEEYLKSDKKSRPIDELWKEIDI